MDVGAILKQCEDHLFRAMKMTIRERAIYYHLLRHTRLLGKDSRCFGIQPLANKLGIAHGSVRESVRVMHDKGCIQVHTSRRGHSIRVLLPSEINDVLPVEGVPQLVDIESLDFFTDRKYVDPLIVRENGLCFYCQREIRRENCELDHVVSQALRGDNSYRNIVVACHECNTHKQDMSGDDYVRSLYRRGVLSQSDLEHRLASLESLRLGKLVPDL